MKIDFLILICGDTCPMALGGGEGTFDCKLELGHKELHRHLPPHEQVGHCWPWPKR